MKHKIKSDKQRLKRGCLFERLKMQKRQYDLWMRAAAKLEDSSSAWCELNVAENEPQKKDITYHLYMKYIENGVWIFCVFLLKQLRSKTVFFLCFQAWIMINSAEVISRPPCLQIRAYLEFSEKNQESNSEQKSPFQTKFQLYTRWGKK